MPSFFHLNALNGFADPSYGEMGDQQNALQLAGDSATRSKDQLWNDYHGMLQRQIALPPDRQWELAMKVKMLRRLWERAEQ